MHILHLNDATAWGGNEQQLVDMVIELEHHGIKNTVLCGRKSELYTTLQALQIDCIQAPEGKYKGKENLKKLRHLKASLKPDIIHLHTSKALSLFIKEDLFAKHKIPAVLSKKGMGSSMSFLSRYKYNYHNVKAMVCISDYVKRSMIDEVIFKRNHKRLSVIYDGININRIRRKKESLRHQFNIADDEKVVLSIANHTKAKDLETLVRTVHHCVDALGMEKLRVIQLGRPTGLTAALKELTASLNIEKHLTFAGFIDNASGFLHQADVLLFTSEREGMGLVLYESFYEETPVVTTNAGGIPELVKHLDTGYVTGVKEYKALAQGLQHTLEHPEETSERTQRAKAVLLKDFTTTSTTQQLIELYKNLLSSER